MAGALLEKAGGSSGRMMGGCNRAEGLGVILGLYWGYIGDILG